MKREEEEEDEEGSVESDTAWEPHGYVHAI